MIVITVDFAIKIKIKREFLSLRLRDIWDITTKLYALSLDCSVRDGYWYCSEPMTEKQDNKSGVVLKFFAFAPKPANRVISFSDLSIPLLFDCVS